MVCRRLSCGSSVLSLFSAATLWAQEPRREWFPPSGTVTEASQLEPREIAGGFLQSVAGQYQLSAHDLAGVYVWREYKTAHNGVTHLVYRQHYQGLDVHGAEWVVNIDREGRIVNAGGSLYRAPAPGLAGPGPVSARQAVRAAVAAVNPALGERYFPFQTQASTGVRFHRGPTGAEIEGRPVWRAVNGLLRPAWVFHVVDEDGVSAYEAVVDSDTSRVLLKEPMTFFQSAPSGLVFPGQSPQPNPMPGVQLTAAPAIVPRSRVALAGDPKASPRGWVSGGETTGNNTVTGANPTGVAYLLTPATAKSAAGDFSFPLELGPDAPNPGTFADAAAVNLFYWANRAHDLFWEIGFDEAAGNFQADNFSRGGQAGDPMYAYAHFGLAATFNAQLNNAFFTTRNVADGSQSMIAMYAGFGSGVFSDGSYDSEVVIHEYTHGVTVRLLRGYASHQTAAMGEAWSDFFGLEFTVPEGAPADGVYPQGEYLFQSFGTGIRTRPYSSRLESNPLTFANIGRVITLPQVHADGEIWATTLWHVRANLIRQFGEKEGRRRTRQLVIDGLKLSVPAPSYVDMRNAILLADRVNFNGASQAQLWDAFAARGLGVLAQSSSGHTAHVLPSFEKPSTAATMRFYESSYSMGETVRIVLQDSNNSAESLQIQVTTSSGDVESVTLRRSGSVLLGSIPTSGGATATRGDGGLALMTGDAISAYYNDADAGDGPRQIEITVPTRPAYTQVTGSPVWQFADETRLNFRAPFFTTRRFDLPFEFPFFGQIEKSVRIVSNGMLFFEMPPSTPCTDAGTLSRFRAIAPLWMELRTNGFAQPNEDVYVSSTPDSITFRWAAETDAIVPGVLPEPVNFATTLWRDGRIQFFYGPGNQNLANGIPFTGCGVSTPTVGLSPGTETFAQTSVFHWGLGSLESAPSVTFFPPFNHSSIPVGILESPAAGQVVKGILNGRGVAYDTQTFVTRIDVMIDGTLRLRTTPSFLRLDVCQQQNIPGCPFVGFNFNVDVEALGLAAGEHTLQLRATNANGAFQTFPDTPVAFTIEPGQSQLPAGAIESPAAGAEFSGAVTIRGWAHAGDLRVIGVDVLIDGITYGRAQYGMPRADICTGLNPRPVNCNNVGFQFVLNTATQAPPLANGTHRLQIRVQDETLRMTLLPETPVEVTVNNQPNAPPKGVLVVPAENERLSGSISLYGYAWDPDGRIVAAQLLVNGEIRATLRYGAERPSECAGLPDTVACPNIGFEGEFDTRGVPNGPAVLGIRLLDDRGGATIIPGTARTGMNVFIQN